MISNILNTFKFHSNSILFNCNKISHLTIIIFFSIKLKYMNICYIMKTDKLLYYTDKVENWLILYKFAYNLSIIAVNILYIFK